MKGLSLTKNNLITNSNVNFNSFYCPEIMPLNNNIKLKIYFKYHLNIFFLI